MICLPSMQLFGGLAEDNQLIEAAKNGDMVNAQSAISNGANIDAKDNNSYTALMYAASYGKTGIAEWLVTRGANVNIKDNRNWTAKTHAADNGNTVLVKFLEDQALIK